jgi:hypothetical protein
MYGNGLSLSQLPQQEIILVFGEMEFLVMQPHYITLQTGLLILPLGLHIILKDSEGGVMIQALINAVFRIDSKPVPLLEDKRMLAEEESVNLLFIIFYYR